MPLGLGIYTENSTAELSSGARRNSGTNGDLVALLDEALVLHGWTIEWSSGNERCYMPGSGKGYGLYVGDDSSISGSAAVATVRGYASQSGGVLTGPFPNATQHVNNQTCWGKSNVASTTARPFRLYVWDTGLHYYSAINGTEYNYGGFYDLAGADADATALASANGTSPNNPYGMAILLSGGFNLAGNNRLHVAKSVDGSVTSTKACFNNIKATTSSGPGNETGFPAARAGYGNSVNTIKTGVNCAGSQTTTPSLLAVVNRGYVPLLRLPVHNGVGSLNNNDTYNETTLPGVSLRVLFSSSPASYGWHIIEENDNWVPPSYG